MSPSLLSQYSMSIPPRYGTLSRSCLRNLRDRLILGQYIRSERDRRRAGDTYSPTLPGVLGTLAKIARRPPAPHNLRKPPHRVRLVPLYVIWGVPVPAVLGRLSGILQCHGCFRQQSCVELLTLSMVVGILPDVWLNLVLPWFRLIGVVHKSTYGACSAQQRLPVPARARVARLSYGRVSYYNHSSSR